MMKRSIRRFALLLVTLALCAVVAAAAGDGTAVSTLKLTAPEGVTLRLLDATGAEMTLSAQSGNVYTYRNLTPGAQYTYIATRDTYYHSSETLTAPDSGSKNWTVTAPKAADEGWLTELALGPDGTAKGAYALDKAFSGAVHSYAAVVPDTPNSVRIWVNGDTAATTFSVHYRQLSLAPLYDDKPLDLTLDKDEIETGKALTNLLVNKNGRGNTLTLRCSQTKETAAGIVTFSQDYVITLTRRPSLENLEIKLGNETQPLTQAETGKAGFDASVSDYTLSVPVSATELTVYPTCYSVRGCYRDDNKNGYHVWYGEQELTSGEGVRVLLEDAQTKIELRVTCDYAEGAERVYCVTVQKSAQLVLQPQLEPENALLFVTDARSGNRVLPDAAGGYTLTAGVPYAYTLTAPGYVGASGTIVSNYDEQGALTLRAGDASIPVTDGTATVMLGLTQAPASAQTAVSAQWADFRGTSYDAQGVKTDTGNNSVRTEKLPIRAEDSTLYWAEKIGDGYSSGAVSCPILVDGDLVVYAGTSLHRVDAVTGKIKATGTMERGSAHATVPPTYADGMILIPLSEGTVQAFDAQTLQSLWVYHDPLRGQPVCPITVCGDYLYVGFWKSETENANFVCLTLTDEDPEKTNEEKTACWYRTQTGGFYWAGAYACEDYVLVGTDNGAGEKEQNVCGNLLMLDAHTGEQLDIWTGLRGDVRSTVCYDGNAFYFTTKGGLFCGVQTEKTTDGWRLKESSKWTVELTNGTSTTAMSTSTPVVYNGRAYVGVCGSSQFMTFSGHNLSVIDLTTHSIAYKVATRGYTQTSGVLTTAYEKKTGKVYVYFFDNYSPGVLRVLEDAPGQTQPSYLTVENGKNTPYILFTPSRGHAQYALCSPVVDENGVIYFKNDSGYLMAFGPSVKLELTQQPKKTEYAAGEKFDAKGMKAELVYANGSRRDVTDYVQYSTDALTAQDAEFTVRFPYVLYHDQQVDGVWTTNVDTTVPTATLTLTITGDAPTVLYGDVNGDGKIDVTDVTMLQRRIAQLLTAEEQAKFQTQNADVSGDGKIDVTDVTLLQQRIAQLISRFPAEGE